MTKKDPNKVQIHPSVQKTDISIPQHLEMIDANLAEQFDVKPGTPRDQIDSLLETLEAEKKKDYSVLSHRLNQAVQKAIFQKMIIFEQVRVATGSEHITQHLTFGQLFRLKNLLSSQMSTDYVCEMFGFPGEKYDELEASIRKGKEWEMENR